MQVQSGGATSRHKKPALPGATRPSGCSSERTATNAAPSSTPVTASVARTSPVVAAIADMNEITAWKVIQSSLEIALVYRSDADIALSLRMLERIPFFSCLSRDDLLAIAAVMTVEETHGAGVVLYTKKTSVKETRHRASYLQETAVGRATPPGQAHRVAEASTAGGASSVREGRTPSDVSAAKASSAAVTVAPATAQEQHGAAADGESSSCTSGRQEVASMSTVVVGSPVRRTIPSAAAATTTTTTALSTSTTHARALSSSEPVHRHDGEEGGGRSGGAQELEEEENDEEVEDEEVTTLVLLQGRVLLELPTATGFERYPVLPWDVFGGRLVTRVLPPGARYLTTAPCTILAVPSSSLASTSPSPAVATGPAAATTAAAASSEQRHLKALSRAEQQEMQQRIAHLSQGTAARVFSEWTEAERARCARQLLPLRLSMQQVLVEEGDAADAMFFLAEGVLTVSRRITLGRERGGGSGTRRGVGRKADGTAETTMMMTMSTGATVSTSCTVAGAMDGREAKSAAAAAEAVEASTPLPSSLPTAAGVAPRTSPTRSPRQTTVTIATDAPSKKTSYTRQLAPTTTMPSPVATQVLSTKSAPTQAVMEVATLQPGEFCGELGLLALNPDLRPGEGIVWSDAYWEAALAERGGGGGATATSANEALAFAGNGGDTAPNACVLAHPNDDNSGDVLREVEPAEEQLPDRWGPRRATVHAPRPCVVYRLSYDACRGCIRGSTLVRLKEFAKGYPSHRDVCDVYVKQERWNQYRKAVFEEVCQKHNENKQHMKQTLPQLK